MFFTMHMKGSLLSKHHIILCCLRNISMTAKADTNTEAEEVASGKQHMVYTRKQILLNLALGTKARVPWAESPLSSVGRDKTRSW